MRFKEYERYISFLDLGLGKTLGLLRTQKFLKEIHGYVQEGGLFQRILIDVYTVEKSAVGNSAFLR
ncbi:MAG TPA: hypothetical protein PK922_13575 [Syntrophorhabdus sp.]|jgi:hypothetical protein|nr:hypothetical protein [Syntrophorhabdus sp.]